MMLYEYKVRYDVSMVDGQSSGSCAAGRTVHLVPAAIPIYQHDRDAQNYTSYRIRDAVALWPCDMTLWNIQIALCCHGKIVSCDTISPSSVRLSFTCFLCHLG